MYAGNPEVTKKQLILIEVYIKPVWFFSKDRGATVNRLVESKKLVTKNEI